MFRAIAGVLSLLASSQVSAQHRSATPQTTSPPLVDEIVVVGRRSGPPLWKVSSGKHLLWILGTPDLVPKDLDWLSDRVLETLGDSQEYLLPPSFGIQISGPIAAARAWKKVKQSRKNADNATLEEVLPAPLYELFSETKQLYAPKRDDLEELRPSYAADKLFDQATRDAGLISDRRIRESLKKQAKRNGVRIVWSSTYAKLKSMKTVLEPIADSSPEAELRCMEAKLGDLELRLERYISDALAWADGDLAPLLARHSGQMLEDVCAVTALMTGPVPAEMKELEAKSRTLWLESVDRALLNNDSSFASLPIGELLRADGLLSHLQHRGYDVKEPSVERND